jgi:hypothetical protein
MGEKKGDVNRNQKVSKKALLKAANEARKRKREGESNYKRFKVREWAVSRPWDVS